MTSMENMIGRAEIDDIDAILAIPTVDPDEVEHVVKNNADSIFSWDYTLARPALRKLYEKAKVGQWNATTDIPWDTDVDVEKTVAADQEMLGRGIDPAIYDGTVVAKWSDAQWLEFPFVPAPAGAVLRRAARMAAPLWILGEAGSGRRRVAMAVCRGADPVLRLVTLFPDEQLAAVLERESGKEPFALFVPEIGERSLLEQERLALLLSGPVSFRLIATSVEVL